jgi:hypothetical protein
VVRTNSVQNFKTGAECARELRDLADKLEIEERMVNLYCQTWFMETGEYAHLMAIRKTVSPTRPAVNIHEDKIREIRLLLESSKARSSNSGESVEKQLFGDSDDERP